jgi:hypothetical protein
MLKPNELRELLHYDSDTGRLVWKERPISLFPSRNAWRRWNGKHAGKEAFTALDDKGYKQGNVLGRHYKAHRVIWALHYGSAPDGHIDHINHDKADNRISNLRDVAKRTNHLNLSRRAGPMGVGRFRQRWRARIMVNYREVHLGTFDTEQEAIAARLNAQREHGFHENHGT